MESNFDIHKWQAEYLNKGIAKKQLNEQVDVLSTAEEALEHVKQAWQAINTYKEAADISSLENPLNEVEAALEGVAEMLEDILDESI